MPEQAERPNDLLVVTTRSRLRGARFFPLMMVATRRIRRQLARTDGLVRWASLVAGPTEFWTITVWRDRYAMQEFVRSDAHGEIMWRVSRWLDSLWLMRWRPPTSEFGSWDGMRLASSATPRTPYKPPATWSARADKPVRRPDLSGAAGVVVRVRTSRLRLAAALLDLARLRRAISADPAVQRAVIGIGRAGEGYLLAVCTDRRAAAAFLNAPLLARSAERWGEDLWAASWRADHEFGHWDGWRLRKARRWSTSGREGGSQGFDSAGA